MLIGVFALPLVAYASLYAPGVTLDPGCAPTDQNCGIATSSPVGIGSAGQIPYYASAGGLLAATSSLTIIQNGYVGIATTSPFDALSVAGNAYLTGSLNVGDTVSTRSNLGLAYAFATNINNAMNIAAWGDSITAGNQDGTGITYPNMLASLANVNVYNGGVPGNGSGQIATRMLAASSMYSWPMIIWAGRNDITGSQSHDEPIIDSAVASMIAAATSTGNTNYIILGILNDAGGSGIWEGATTTNYAEITSINSDLASTYGANHYLNVREWLVQNGLSVMGIATSTTDAIDAAADVIPVDLAASGPHLNAAGYTAVARYLYQNIGLLKNYPAYTITTNNLQKVFDQSVNVTGYVNTDQYSGFEQAGISVLYASTTNSSLAVGDPLAAGWLAASSSPFYDVALGPTALGAPISGAAQYNTAIGYGALDQETSGTNNTALGAQALYNTTTGSYDAALSRDALVYNTTGSYDLASGAYSLDNNTTGSNDTALGAFDSYSNTTGANNTGVGYYSLYNNTSGASNTAIGYEAELYNVSATSTTAIGYRAAYSGNPYHNQGDVYLGYEAGFFATTSSDYNTFLGYQSGYDVTSGTDNILVGPELTGGGNHLTTGSGNIGIGFNTVFPGGVTASNQLNIGNFIFGTSLTATSSSTSIPSTLTGFLGIGTSSPYSTLEVWGPNSGATSTAFSVVNSASTTAFAVFNNGNATYSGSIFQSSDERLKTSITPLDASTSLADILGLVPVSYTRIDQPDQGSNLGFIAQAVEQTFPELVSTTSPTSLTSNGTLTLNYVGLIAPMVASIQALANEIGGFAQSMTTKELNATDINGTTVSAQQLCLGSTCLSETELQTLLQADGQAAGSAAAVPSAATTVPMSSISAAVPSIAGEEVIGSSGATTTATSIDTGTSSPLSASTTSPD